MICEKPAGENKVRPWRRSFKQPALQYYDGPMEIIS